MQKESIFHPLFKFYLFYFICLFVCLFLLYWFCHTLTWIQHGCICIPKHEPPSHLPPHNISLGHPHAPAPSMLYPTSDIDWRFSSYMIVYMLEYHVPSIDFQFSSVQFSHSVVSDSLQPHESQHARPPCPSPTPGVHSNSRPSSRWCHPAISSSVVPFSSCPQSLPASEFFPMSQLFAWRGQSTGASALASVLPKNTQDLSPLELTGWISLQPKGLSRVFSNTTVQKHQFFGAQPSL